jgi:hypothetical protein
MSRGFRPGLLTSAILLVVSASCGGGNGAEPTDLPSGSLGVVTPADAREAVLGLCASVGSLDDDPVGAEEAFTDRSHDELHVIAAALQEVDREAAADLLEAKQRVEAGFAGPDGPSAEEMESLIAATRVGLDVLSIETPSCPD